MTRCSEKKMCPNFSMPKISAHRRVLGTTGGKKRGRPWQGNGKNKKKKKKKKTKERKKKFGVNPYKKLSNKFRFCDLRLSQM